MRSIAPLRAAKIGYIVMSVLFCLLGLVLLVWPNLSISLIGIAAGIMLIVFGLVKLGGYFTRDLYELAFQHDLAFGLLLIALGVMLLAFILGLASGSSYMFHTFESLLGLILGLAMVILLPALLFSKYARFLPPQRV